MLSRVVLLSCLIVGSQNAFATLGGGINSLEADRQSVSADAVLSGPVSFNGYSMYSITYKSRVVQEYATSDGKIFSIAWSTAHKQPDLTVLLGGYWDEYNQSPQSTPKILSRMSKRAVETTDLYVLKGGSRYNFMGLSYLKPLPSGVTEKMLIINNQKNN